MWGGCALGPYVGAVDALCRRFAEFGRFVNSRPFLTGAIIKLPLRLEFVAKKAVQGDLVGVGVGLSWMVLGDGALALNDERLKRRVSRWRGPGRRGAAPPGECGTRRQP
jgi:hypothetical protein